MERVRTLFEMTERKRNESMHVLVVRSTLHKVVTPLVTLISQLLALPSQVIVAMQLIATAARGATSHNNNNSNNNKGGLINPTTNGTCSHRYDSASEAQFDTQ